MVCLFMVDIVVALVGSMRRSMLDKGNLSFGCVLYNLKEFTLINLHIFFNSSTSCFFFFGTDNWLLIRIGPGVLGSAPKFTSSSFSFGRIYAFLSISVSFSRTFISSILAFLLLSFFCPRDPSNHGYCFLLLGWEPLGILEMGALRDPNNGIFSSWSWFTIKNIFSQSLFCAGWKD